MCKIIEDLVKEEREEGREEGRKEGREEGREEGRAENMSETALRMFKAGKYPLEEISELSGLPLEKVKELREKQN